MTHLFHPHLIGLLAGIGSLTCANNGDPPSHMRSETDLDLVFVPEPSSPTGDSRQEILERLAPLPSGPTRIAYRVTGPAKLEGTLTLTAAPGGLRRYDWQLTLPVGSAPTTVSGTSVQTPDGSWWSGNGSAPFVPPGGPAGAPPQRIGAVADGIARLDADTRTQLLTALAAWHSRVAAAQRAYPADTEIIAGQTCSRVQLGSHEICLWETMGIPLRLRGSEFVIDAWKIESSISISNEFFAPPALATAITATELSAPERAIIEAAARGDTKAVADLHHLSQFSFAL